MEAEINCLEKLVIIKKGLIGPSSPGVTGEKKPPIFI